MLYLIARLARRRLVRGGARMAFGRAYRFLTAVAPAVALALAALAIGVPARAIETRVPSASAGPGGKLAVRVATPAARRYAAGAPVVVLSQGGHEPGTVLYGSTPFTQQGFLFVTFIYPGGRDTISHSDGVYDYRGADCQLALRDVLRFATGAITDSAGRTISDLAGMPALPANVGVFASSNGGSIAPIALAQYGATLPGVRWMVGWENPTGPQTISGDLGVAGKDCQPAVDGDGNGVPTDDAKNWAYIGYDTSVCVLDYTTLRYDPAFVVNYRDPARIHPTVNVPGMLFIDGNGNGVYDVLPGPLGCSDLDSNGRLDPTEDYLLSAPAIYGPATAGDSLKVPLTPAVLTAAQNSGLFGAAYPRHLLTPAQSAAFWSQRDATAWYAKLGADRPDFAALLVFRTGDHVQATQDHAHIRQAYDGFRNHGMWCRLNTDRSYYEALAAPLASYIETPANFVVAGSGSNMKAHAEPNVILLPLAQAAGCAEMADRTQMNAWDADLDAVIPPAAGVDVRDAAAAEPRVETLGFVRGDGVLRARISGFAEGAELEATLLDVAGRLIRSTKLIARENRAEWRWTLGVPHAGFYWLRVRDGGGRMAGARVIVAR